MNDLRVQLTRRYNQPDPRSRMVPSKRKAIHVNDLSDVRFEVKSAWKERLLDPTPSNRSLKSRETRAWGVR